MNSKHTSAILLMNLGSPDSTQVKDVRKYLNEFLMDERVIDLPWLARTLLVRGITVPCTEISSSLSLHLAERRITIDHPHPSIKGCGAG
jgi:protoheme ferro-lyase